VAYFQFINTRTSGYGLDYGYARLSGPIPGVNFQGGALKFAAGVEHRVESTFDNPDSVIVNGDGHSNAAPTKGSYNVTSEYLDLLAPIFKDKDFAKSLDLEGSVRHDSYNIFGTANDLESVRRLGAHGRHPLPRHAVDGIPSAAGERTVRRSVPELRHRHRSLLHRWCCRTW